MRYVRIDDIDCAVITIGGMVDKETLTHSVVTPVTQSKISGNTKKEKYEFIRDNVISASDQVQVSNFQDAFNIQ